MMKEEEIVSNEELLAELGLADALKISQSENFLKRANATLLMKVSHELQMKEKEVRGLKNNVFSLKTSLNRVSNKLEEKEKQTTLEKIFFSFILMLKDLCKYSIEFAGDFNWIIVIHEIKEERYYDLLNLFMEYERSVVRKLWRRLKPDNPFVKIKMESIKAYIEKKKKPLSEKLKEFDLSELSAHDLSELFNMRSRKVKFERI